MPDEASGGTGLGTFPLEHRQVELAYVGNTTLEAEVIAKNEVIT
jgi:hypothetical protein